MAIVARLKPDASFLRDWPPYEVLPPEPPELEVLEPLLGAGDVVELAVPLLEGAAGVLLGVDAAAGAGVAALEESFAPSEGAASFFAEA